MNKVPPNPVAFAMVGDTTDPGVASGTPYFALTEATQCGWRVRGLKLATESAAITRRRMLWNVRQLLTTGAKGGYQYSEAFLDTLWRQDPPKAGEDVINMFQLYPTSVLQRHQGRIFFYVDQTLRQMFETYGLGVPAVVMSDAMRREKEQYQRADLVFTQSQYAADSVIQDYGVEADKVRAVVCGANLYTDDVARWEVDQSVTDSAGPLKLVFVGKDWARKGLDRLIAGMEQARQLGGSVELTVIGTAKTDVPPALANTPGINWVGFVDKRRNAGRFIDLVARCDVGCLLSHAEAGGMSLREFCRLGLITLAPAVGGSPEYVAPGATHLVPTDANADAIGAILNRLATDKNLRHRQKAVAWEARHTASWADPIATLAAHLAEA